MLKKREKKRKRGEKHERRMKVSTEKRDRGRKKREEKRNMKGRRVWLSPPKKKRGEIEDIKKIKMDMNGT